MLLISQVRRPHSNRVHSKSDAENPKHQNKKDKRQTNQKPHSYLKIFSRSSKQTVFFAKQTRTMLLWALHLRCFSFLDGCILAGTVIIITWCVFFCLFPSVLSHCKKQPYRNFEVTGGKTAHDDTSSVLRQTASLSRWCVCGGCGGNIRPTVFPQVPQHGSHHWSCARRKGRRRQPPPNLVTSRAKAQGSFPSPHHPLVVS